MIGRICQRQVDVAAPDESAKVAAERMHQRCVGTLVIVDAEQRPLGILTDRDLVLRVLATGADPSATTVGEVMSAPTAVVRDDAELAHALQVMKQQTIRRLVVVDAEGRLVGVVSLDDLLVLLAEDLTSIATISRAEAPTSLESCAGS